MKLVVWGTRIGNNTKQIANKYRGWYHLCGTQFMVYVNDKNGLKKKKN